MTQNFKLSRYIKKDIKKISSYMSISGMQKLIKELNYKFQNLRLMPQVYQRIYYDNKKEIDYRRCVYKKYIIIYKIHKNQITILRIISHRENYLKSDYLKSL